MKMSTSKDEVVLIALLQEIVFKILLQAWDPSKV